MKQILKHLKLSVVIGLLVSASIFTSLAPVNTAQAQDPAPEKTCNEGYKLEGDKCVSDAKKVELAYTLVGSLLPNDMKEDAYKDYQNKCAGQSTCAGLSQQSFITGYFAEDVRLCTQTASSASGVANQRDSFATCLSGKYASLTKTEVKDAVASIDFADAQKKITDGSTQDATAAPTDEEAEKSCATEMSGVGWIVCPVISVASGFADGVWALFEQLLVVNPLSSDIADPYFKTWEIMRNIANALIFVIFLVIIFSQISNIGISNYGIKKMLPRFILVAIAINISYFLMQISVDVANILGKTIDDILTSSVVNADLSKVGWEQILLDMVAAGLTFAAPAAIGVVAGITVGSIVGAPVAILFILLLIIPGIIGIVAGVMALFFRTAVIPVLAVLAPIALAAWILPNTQKVFDKWKSVFTSMLFLYPLAALYYGALKFFAMTILNDTTSGTFQRLMALSLLFIGSFVVLIIAMKSNSMVNGMMKGISGAFNKITAPARSLGMGAVGGMAALKHQQMLGSEMGAAKNRRWFNPAKYGSAVARFGQGRVKAFDRNKWAREQGVAVAKGDREQAYQKWAHSERDGQFGKISGVTKGSATGDAYMNRLTETAVKNQEAKISSMSIREMGEELKRAISAGDNIGAMAAQNRLLTSGPPGLKEFNKQLAATDGGGAMYGDLSSNFRANHSALMSQDNVTQAWATADTRAVDANGKQTEDGTWANAESRAMQRVADNGLTAEKFAGLSEEAQSRIFNNMIGPPTEATTKMQSGMSTESLKVLADASSNQGGKISDAVRQGISAELANRSSSSQQTQNSASSQSAPAQQSQPAPAQQSQPSTPQQPQRQQYTPGTTTSSGLYVPTPGETIHVNRNRND